MSAPVREGPGGSVELDISVVPRASRDRVVGLHDDRVKIQVTAPPVDGAANDAVARFLARELGLPRSGVELVRGVTGRRKTWRIAGTTIEEVRRRLGLAAAAAALLAGCEPAQRELPMEVVLPEDSADLEAADNLAFVLEPDGISGTIAVDGTDFGLELVLEPDLVPRTLTLYLADGDELLAWGRSGPFFTAGADVGLAVFLARPGRLSTFPADLGAAPDPDVLATRAPGRGMLLLDADGDTFLLNEFDLQVESGSRLDGAPAPSNGTLVPAEDGAVLRVAPEGALRVWRYAPGDDQWTAAVLDGEGEVDRSGAAVLLRDDLARVFLIGGGGRTDGIALGTAPDAEGRLAAAPIEALELDAPRDGASAIWRPGDDAAVILFGSDGDSVPVLFDTGTGEGAGPPGPWLGGRCVAYREAPSRTLCLGGVRDGSATADAILYDPTSGVTELPGLLPDPIDDPLLLADDGAVYAQGAGAFYRIPKGLDAPSAADVEVVPTSALRARGGHSVTLGTGASFLVGGTTADGGAVDRWQVFQPALDGPE